jgi:small GTP-binding protein
VTTAKRKICLLGDVGVGKTSLTRRFVHGGFSPDYLTTVGVRVDTRLVPLPDGGAVKLVIWDIAGTDALATVNANYLRGAAGYLLVSDGTRPETLDVAAGLRSDLEAVLGRLPFVALVNKRDLEGEWVADEAGLRAWSGGGGCLLTTSARTGENVEAAFLQLAMQLRISGAGDD